MFNMDPLSQVDEEISEVEIENVTVVSIEDAETLEIAAVGGKPSRQKAKGTSRSKKTQASQGKEEQKRAAAHCLNYMPTSWLSSLRLEAFVSSRWFLLAEFLQQAIEPDVDNRRYVQSQDLRNNQSADNNADRAGVLCRLLPQIQRQSEACP